MTKYNIILYCKDKLTLRKIFRFLSLRYNTELKKVQTPLYFSQKKIKIKKITVLKSPHVNKTAQTHFEHRIYSIELQVYSYKPQRYLFILKKIQNSIFPEIRIKIKQKTQKLIENKFFNPDNYKTGFVEYNYNKQQRLKYKKNKSTKALSPFSVNKKLLEKALLYIKMFDQYGNVNSFK